jgi:hypothetical protein
MSEVDKALERAAGKLDELAEAAARKGGVAERAAPALADDADFLRTIGPSKVVDRIRSEGPERAPRERAPRDGRGNKGGGKKSGGLVSSLAPAGAALALGILIAKLVEWRSYAEPRA